MEKRQTKENEFRWHSQALAVSDTVFSLIQKCLHSSCTQKKTKYPFIHDAIKTRSREVKQIITEVLVLQQGGNEVVALYIAFRVDHYITLQIRQSKH